MKKPIETEIVQRIERPYVGKDCIQIFIPFENDITLLSQDGIMLQKKSRSNITINNYLEDERRKQFPYYNIPTYYTKRVFKNIMGYSNQLLDYEKPYIRIGDNIVYELFVVKDNHQALLIQKLMSDEPTNKVCHVTYEELQKLIDKRKEEEQIYYVYLDGSVQSKSRLYPNKERIKDFIKKEIMFKNVQYMKEYPKTHADVISFLLNTYPWILNYMEKSINNLDLSLIDYNLGFSEDYSPFLVIRINNGKISMQTIDVTFVKQNNFKVEISDIPVNKYTLEQLKCMPKIKSEKEPRIPLKLNPGVTKQEIREAKQMVRELRK